MEKILTKPAAPYIFCSELSKQRGESMAGTSPTIDAWFLLEYTDVWMAEAAEDNHLPRPVQAWLKEQLGRVENGRVQFIKQDRPRDSAVVNVAKPITFFVALTREVEPRLYQFRLDRFEDLFRLDVSAILSGRGDYDSFLREEPLYLVCTNGKRDRCCSRVGVTLYQALAGQVGDAAWQCTHLGGHRFAPTVAAFPDGALYGRLAPPDLNGFIESQEREELFLSHLRGRCCYSDVTQAADHFLRRETGWQRRSALSLSGISRLGETTWEVRFVGPAVGETHRVVVSREISDTDRVVSCSPLKAKPVPQFRFVSLEKDVA